MEIKPYQIGDEIAILELFKESFGKTLSMDFWTWRYRQNPFSDLTQAHLMWDEEKLVGHYAVCPVNMISGVNKIKTALSMTTMTHPEYTGKGIFKDLAESLYTELYNRHHFEMVWGFPNLNSHYGFMKNLKWNDIACIPTLKLKHKALTNFISKNYISFNSISDLQSKHIMSLSKSALQVQKTELYLNWRYTDNPVNRYHVIASEKYPNEFVVIKIFNSFENSDFQEIDIVEHGFENDNDVIQELIGAILSFSKHNNLNLISVNTWMSLHDSRHLLLEKNKFVLDSPITLLGNRILSNGNSKSWTNFQDWNITMGDSDVY